MKAVTIGGVEDHLHLLLAIPPTLTVSKALQLLKGGSSAWIKQTFPGMRRFGWQDGYGAFTVSKSSVPEVVDYIKDQRQRHRKKTFQEEFKAFLKKHDIEYDERYLGG